MEIEIKYSNGNPMHGVVTATIEKNDILTSDDVENILINSLGVKKNEKFISLLQEYLFTKDSSGIRDMSSDDYISKYPLDYFEAMAPIMDKVFNSFCKEDIKSLEKSIKFISALASVDLYYQTNFLKQLHEDQGNIPALIESLGSKDVDMFYTKTTHIDLQYRKQESFFVPSMIEKALGITISS